MIGFGFPPYGGRHTTVTPHLTIATRLADAELDRIEADVKPWLPIERSADACEVWEHTDRWVADDAPNSASVGPCGAHVHQPSNAAVAPSDGGRLPSAVSPASPASSFFLPQTCGFHAPVRVLDQLAPTLRRVWRRWFEPRHAPVDGGGRVGRLI